MKNLLTLITCFLLAKSNFPQIHSQSALQDRQKFKPSDFVYDLYKATPLVGQGGYARTLLVENHPILKGMSVSSVIFEIYPCGIVPPHIHPRFVLF